MTRYNRLYMNLCIKLHLPYIIFRGLHLSPLFCWGKWTAVFTNGVVFGWTMSCDGWIYNIGPLILYSTYTGEKLRKHSHEQMSLYMKHHKIPQKIWRLKYVK